MKMERNEMYFSKEIFEFGFTLALIEMSVELISFKNFFSTSLSDLEEMSL
jgi:hypothetical protein